MAVLPGHVINDLLPPFVAEVHVDVRHGDALRVQEALEQKLVFQRVQHGDVQAVGHDAARAAAAPGADHDAVVLGVFDEVPDDQKIIHIAHPRDDGQLVFQPVASFLIVRRVTLGEPFLAEPPQHGIRRFAFGHVVPGQVDGMEIKVHLAALCDFLCALNRLVQAGEQIAHFLLGLDIQLLRVLPHAVVVFQRLAHLDAHQHFLGVGVPAGEVVAVVGRHQRNAGAFAHFD